MAGAQKSFWRSTAGRTTLVGGLFSIAAVVLSVFLPRWVGEGGDSQASLSSGYYRTDGTTPPLSPSCVDGIFTLCLGDNLDEAKRLFGQESTKFGDPDHVAWRWDLAGSIVVVEVDQVGQVIGLTASVRDASSDFRLNIPGPLTLG